MTATTLVDTTRDRLLGELAGLAPEVAKAAAWQAVARLHADEARASDASSSAVIGEMLTALAEAAFPIVREMHNGDTAAITELGKCYLTVASSAASAGPPSRHGELFGAWARSLKITTGEVIALSLSFAASMSASWCETNLAKHRLPQPPADAADAIAALGLCRALGEMCTAPPPDAAA